MFTSGRGKEGSPPKPPWTPPDAPTPRGGQRNFRDQASTTSREATPRNWTHSTPEGKVLGVGNLGPKTVNSTRWKPTKFIPMKWFKLVFLFNGFIKQTLLDWAPFITGHIPEAWRGSATLHLEAPLPLAGACISDEVCKHPKKWMRWRITQGEEAGLACQGQAFLPRVRVYSSPAGKQPAWGRCLQGVCPFFYVVANTSPQAIVVNVTLSWLGLFLSYDALIFQAVKFINHLFS